MSHISDTSGSCPPQSERCCLRRIFPAHQTLWAANTAIACSKFFDILGTLNSKSKLNSTNTTGCKVGSEQIASSSVSLPTGLCIEPCISNLATSPFEHKCRSQSLHLAYPSLPPPTLSLLFTLNDAHGRQFHFRAASHNQDKQSCNIWRSTGLSSPCRRKQPRAHNKQSTAHQSLQAEAPSCHSHSTTL